MCQSFKIPAPKYHRNEQVYFYDKEEAHEAKILTCTINISAQNTASIFYQIEIDRQCKVVAEDRLFKNEFDLVEQVTERILRKIKTKKKKEK